MLKKSICKVHLIICPCLFHPSHVKKLICWAHFNNASMVLRPSLSGKIHKLNFKVMLEQIKSIPEPVKIYWFWYNFELIYWIKKFFQWGCHLPNRAGVNGNKLKRCRKTINYLFWCRIIFILDFFLCLFEKVSFYFKFILFF